MAKRSTYVALTAAAGGGALMALRRARLRRVAEGIRTSILPTHVTAPGTEPRPAVDEAHAPGHAHLPPPEGPDGPVAVTRPWNARGDAHREPHIRN